MAGEPSIPAGFRGEMNAKNTNSCGRQLALRIEAANGSKHDAAAAIHEHCDVSLLRAHRIAYGYTLTEAAELLKDILRERGRPAEGLAHQRISRWENGLDMPTQHYLNALCFLYRTRPDRLGFGFDYSCDDDSAIERKGHPPSDPDSERRPGHATASASADQEVGGDVRRREFLQSAAVGVLAISARPGSGSSPASGLGNTAAAQGTATVDALEMSVERSGYDLYTSDPADFIPSRLIDIAAVQRLLLLGQTLDVQRKLNRVLAKNAGFIGIRLVDIAELEETFNWFRTARQAVRQAGDVSTEAWLAGHLCDAHACYGHSIVRGLDSARAAQTLGGTRPNSAAVFGFLAEAGVQARLGRRRETIEAVVRSDKMFAALPADATVEDGMRVPEYFLRWHQSNALSVIGERQLADPLRERTLELPFSARDVVGRALLELDEASLLYRSGELEHGCTIITRMWEGLAPGFRTGQIPRRVRQVVEGLSPADLATREVRTLRERLSNTAGAKPGYSAA